LKKVVAHPKPILITLISNWLVVPPLRLLMTRLLLQGNEQLIVAILLGIAPCTAMVLIWGLLADGNQEQNFVNTSLNTLIIIVLYAPLVKFYTGIQNIDLSWMDLLISSAVFIGSPFLVGLISRNVLVNRKGKDWFNKKYIPFMNKVAMVALLTTLIVLFTLNGQALIAHPDLMVVVSSILLILYPVIALVNILITRALRLEYRDASIAVIIGSSSHFEIAIATAITLFGVGSQAALGTTMGLFWEVPTMLTLVYVLKKLRDRKFYPARKTT
jgi:ACR3 family arsenite transporter